MKTWSRLKDTLVIPRWKAGCTECKEHVPRLTNDLFKLSLRCLDNFSWNAKFTFGPSMLRWSKELVSNSLSTTTCKASYISVLKNCSVWLRGRDVFSLILIFPSRVGWKTHWLESIAGFFFVFCPPSLILWDLWWEDTCDLTDPSILKAFLQIVQ